jgi:hypothetical protein
VTIDPGILIAIIGGVFAVLASYLTFQSTRGKTKADSKTSLDQRIDERMDAQLQSAWKRLDELEEDANAKDIELGELKNAMEELERTDKRKMQAVGRIFRAIQRQWPTATGPDLDPHDIHEIEDTVPPEWIRRPGSPPAAG